MIIGHQNIINLLDRSLKKGKISQAYIFSGPESVGKFLLARIFAKSLIEEEDFAKACRKGDEKITHPDLLIIEPEKDEKRGVVKEKEIKIEQIKEAQKSLLLFPYQGKYKILVINNAHRMNSTAQNSLLKTLEEPNSTSIIILIAHYEQKILPTLRSRCQRIKFSLVDDLEIKKGFEASGKKITDEIISLAMGRPGAALELVNNKEELIMRNKTLDNLANLSSLNINDRMKMAEDMSKNIVEAIKKLEIWIWLLRSSYLSNMKSKKIGASDNFRKIEMIEKSLHVLRETNANSRLVIENLLINL